MPEATTLRRAPWVTEKSSAGLDMHCRSQSIAEPVWGSEFLCTRCVSCLTLFAPRMSLTPATKSTRSMLTTIRHWPWHLQDPLLLEVTAMIILYELEIHISYPWKIRGSTTLQNVLKYVDFRRSTITKGTIFCDTKSFSLIVHRRFGKTYCVYLQSSRGSKKQEASSNRSLFYPPTLKRERKYFPPKRRWTFTEIHGLTYQQMMLFIAIKFLNLIRILIPNILY
jgi:hypothetical protein